MMRNILLIMLTWFISYGITKAQVMADFETAGSTPLLGGEQVAVVDNPSTTGNPSNKVVFYKKTAGNWKPIGFDFTTAMMVKKNDRLTFKLRSSTKGRVFVKFCNGICDVANTMKEDWAPIYGFQPEANQWTECYIDVTSIQNQTFNRIEIYGSVDNEAAADVYIDDLKLFNSLALNGEPIVDLQATPTQITAGSSVSFDASGSYDSDGTISSYSWDFGDGQTGTGAMISHAFTNSGIFKTVLTVKDNENKTTKDEVLIYVLPSSGKLSQLSFFTTSPKKYEKVEAGFLINATYTNVYNPDEVAVNALITLPDMTTMTVPCFYYQKGYYQAAGDAWKKDANISYWMLRFSSPQNGTHKVKLQLIENGGTPVLSGEQTINIATGTKKGYIKQDASHRQYYRHTTGQPYTPLGINVAWDSTNDYATIMNSLSTGKANFLRYWHAGFDRQTLEWTGGFYEGLGKYSQEAAAEQDSIMNLCEAKELYLQMCIFHHGMFSQTVNSNWADNPYNSAKGGTLSSAEQFFYNETAKAQTKKLLRYIVARWGYSSSLFAWELFNEVNFTGNHPNQTAQWRPGVLAWHDEMGQYIKSLDAFDHLVTTSDDETQLTNLDKKQGLDVVQYHLYNTNLLSVQTSKDKSIRTGLTRTGLINGEYGLDINTADVPFDTQRIAIWTGIMNQVPHLMWLWDNYKQQTWSDLFKYPAQYLEGEDFASEGTLSEWVFAISVSSGTLSSNGFYSTAKNYYAIVYSATHANNISGAVCNFSALPAGIYKITLYNTLTGETTVVNNVNIYPNSNKYTLPTFSKAIALKVEYVSAITTPFAVAGDDKIIALEASVSLSGANSYSPSGNPLDYTWTITQKPVASTLTLTEPKAASLSITPDVAGIYKLSLVVKDGENVSAADEVIITVNEITALDPLNPLADISLFPNPSSKMVKIEFIGSNTSKAYLKIRDTKGALLAFVPISAIPTQKNEAIIQLEDYDLKSGMYILELNNGRNSIYKRMIYQRK